MKRNTDYTRYTYDTEESKLMVQTPDEEKSQKDNIEITFFGQKLSAENFRNFYGLQWHEETPPFLNTPDDGTDVSA
jgi:hypothetical protein